MTTLAEASQKSTSALKEISETPLLDTQVLLAHILGKTRSWVLAHPEQQLSPQEIEEFNRSIKKLKEGIPLPYVLGQWEFFGLEFTLTPDVLIPRPETELLVEQAIDWLYANPERRWAADVGTGSGCIAVTLAHKIEDLKLTAGDISMEALRVAITNAMRHSVEKRIHFVQADLTPPSENPYDLICANLPYIPSSELSKLQVFGREPSLALDGGRDGLEIILRLLEQSRQQLAPGGILLAEIETGQGEAARRLAERYFPEADIQIDVDLAGCDRILVIKMIK